MNNLVLFDKPTYEKLLKEVPTYKLITLIMAPTPEEIRAKEVAEEEAREEVTRLQVG